MYNGGYIYEFNIIWDGIFISISPIITNSKQMLFFILGLIVGIIMIIILRGVMI